MEKRMARFIAGLRASGVRISMAESQDAWRAIEYMGIEDKKDFKLSLRGTLIKDHHDFMIFDELFDMYFGPAAPPVLNPEAELTPEEQQMLDDAINEMALDMSMLLDWLMRGQTPSQEEMDQLMEQAGMQHANNPYQQEWYMRRLQRLLDWDRLDDVLNAIFEKLAEMGMDPQQLAQLRQMVDQNRGNVEQQLDDMVGEQIQENMLNEAKQRRDNAYDLMERPFERLSETEADVLREQVRRLAARIRTRSSLRQKRGKKGQLDAKSTIRASLRYGGVPFEMKMKTKRTKPKVAVIMDVSQSMRHVIEFFLRLTYELDDQIQKMTTFAFYERLEDVTSVMGSHGEINNAVAAIYRLFPYIPYGTDLGKGLQTLADHHMSTIDHRTTVIVVGDGRNNHNDPNLSVFEDIGKRARKVIWMNPEYPNQWGSGDSDMNKYQPLCDEVFQVRNLKQLSNAIDAMLT
jgi:hypothetical protein